MAIMAANKREIFNQMDLNNMYRYFHPLRNLVKEWFHLVILVDKFFRILRCSRHGSRNSRSRTAVCPLDVDKVAEKVLDYRKDQKIVGWQSLQTGSTVAYVADQSQTGSSASFCLAPRRVRQPERLRREKCWMAENR